MNGRYVYFTFVSLLGVLCSLTSFIPYFLLTLFYMYYLYRYKRFSFTKLLVIIVVFLLFLVSSQSAVLLNKSKTPQTTTLFFLQYIDDPMIDGDQLQIITQDVRTHEKFLLQYKITTLQEKKLLESKSFYGCLCKITGSLEKPSQAKNTNAFNYREYLERNQIFWKLKTAQMPLRGCNQKKLSVLLFLKQIRFNGINNLKNNLPPEVASLSAALIYGDQTFMPKEALTSYQKIGITHLLAISGLQVSLLIGVLFYIGIRLGITREGMMDLTLIILPIYAVLTGGSPSVVRAVVMIFLVLCAIRWNKKVKLMPLDALCIAFSLYLLFKPMVVFDVGFQLSFAVSCAIILSAKNIMRKYHHSFSRMLSVTIAAQLASLPFILYYFFEVSLISILANLIFVPLYSFLFLPVVYLLFFFQLTVGTIPLSLIAPFSKLVQFSTVISQMLSLFPFGNFIPGRPSAFLLLIYTIILIGIFFFWEQPYSMRRMRTLTIVCIVLVSFQSCWYKLNPIGEVSIIDVGQGDSILIHLPYGRGNVLIDTGGKLPFQVEEWQKRKKTFEIGEDVVIPYLKSKGIKQIDQLILTHGDLDHIGGALAIIKELRVRQIILPSVAQISESELSIIHEAGKKQIPVVFVSAGDRWVIKDSSFFVLSPEKNFEGERNRGSIAILVKVGGLSWFFGGDLDGPGEEEIVKKYPTIAFDVLKVGHHGSKTSSSKIFLNHYKPHIALISVGEKNRFGHPSQEVLERLKGINAVIYRTDKKGEITYRFLNGEGTFTTYLP